MTKTLKHAGVEYDLDKLIKIKGEGVSIKISDKDCITDSSTLISADTKVPIVIKREGVLLILVDTARISDGKTFTVSLISKHTLKKCKIEKIPVVNHNRVTPNQGSFLRSSPWILSSESARREIRQ